MRSGITATLCRETHACFFFSAYLIFPSCSGGYEEACFLSAHCLSLSSVLVIRIQQLQLPEVGVKTASSSPRSVQMWRSEEKATGCGNATEMSALLSSAFYKSFQMFCAVWSGRWWVGRSHLRGKSSAAERGTRSRHERRRRRRTAAREEVPSFPPCNHWEDAWRERGRERNTQVLMVVMGFSAQ